MVSCVLSRQSCNLKIFEVERLSEDLTQRPVLNGVSFLFLEVQHKFLETVLLVNIEPNFVEQSVDDLRGRAYDVINSDFSNGLDVINGALVLHKASVILRPTIVH